jgi:glycosyltransferase involved in cell wall biosynthesis
MSEDNTSEAYAFAISEASQIGLPGEVVVRGWAQKPEQVVSVRIRIAGRVVGVSSLDTPRRDVAAKFGVPVDPPHGFQFTGRPSVGALAGQSVEAVFVGHDGKALAAKRRPLVESIRLDDFDVVYDFESRQLRLKGCLFPVKHLRGITVLFARDKQHAIRNIFEFRPDAVHLDPQKRVLYSGFSDRISYVGEGDLRQARLRFDFTDGTNRLWAIPMSLVRMNAPEGDIEEVLLDWMRNRMDVKGWYRSHAPVTGIEVRLDGQRVYAPPVIAPNDRIQKALGFRGQMAQAFNFAAPLDVALADPDALFTGDIQTSLRLTFQEEDVLTLKLDQGPAKRVWGRINLMQFDQRSNVFHCDGVFAGPMIPVKAQLILNGRPVDAPLPLQASLRAGRGHFTWLHEINAVYPTAGPVELELYDDRDRVIGTLTQEANRCLLVSRNGAVNGLSDAALSERLLAAYRDFPLPKAPSVCFVMQGSASDVGAGGGVRRMIDLMQSFRDAGYVTMLIDRSEPWNMLRSSENYRQLRCACDRHIFVPSAIKREMACKLADAIDAGLFPHPAGFRKDGKTMAELLRNPPPREETPGLKSRIDPQFSLLCAALVNGFSPRVMISSYGWSGAMHDYLDPSIHGVIDTIDIQSMRAEVFAKAQADFGEEAVPDLAKFDAALEDEVDLLARAATIMTISRAEQEFLCEHIDPSRIVFAGVSARATKALPHSDPASRKVLFVGNAYEPNVDGITQFLKQAWPAVLERVPDAELVICGLVCGQIEDPALPSVRVLGPVENLTAEYETAAVALNPIRFGTGTSVKLVETLGMGRSIVATPVGARGFEAAADHGALALADMDEFAETVVSLLLEPEKRRAMEEAAVSFAAAHLAPEVAHVDLFNLLESRLYY